MGLRETLNENPGLTTAATAIIIVAAIVFMVISMFRGEAGTAGGTGTALTREFYSDDDGKTFFEDERTKVPPFDRNGKPAYRARVFTCDGGKTKFVGWLERYTPEAKKFIEERAKNAAGAPVMMEDQTGLQFKKPGTGDKGWVSAGEAATTALREVNCPNGSPADPVMPP